MKEFSRTVIFDGECGFCRRSIRLGRRLDWLKRIDWQARTGPSTVNKIESVRADGTRLGGFYAVRDIAIHMPLTFLPALLLYIPGVSLLGVPAYRWISENRHRFGGKSSDNCRL